MTRATDVADRIHGRRRGAVVSVAIVACRSAANVVLFEQRLPVHAFDVFLVLVRWNSEIAHVLGIGVAVAARGRNVGGVDGRLGVVDLANPVRVVAARALRDA